MGASEGAGFATACGMDTQLVLVACSGIFLLSERPALSSVFSTCVVSEREGKICSDPDLRPESVWLLDPAKRAGSSSRLVVISSVVGPRLREVAVGLCAWWQGASPHTGCDSRVSFRETCLRSPDT